LDRDDLIMDAYSAVCRYLRCEPSSAAAFAGLTKLSLCNENRVMVLNTGTFKARCQSMQATM
jgi:hypothetical protein